VALNRAAERFPVPECLWIGDINTWSDDVMSDKRRVALSSLAVSVCAVALLSVSGVAKSDPEQCDIGLPCSLGWSISIGVWQNWWGDWPNVFWDTYSGPGVPGTHEDFGTCQIQSEDCGCEGTKVINRYVGYPLDADYRYDDPNYEPYVWNFYDWQYVPTFLPESGDCYIP
jgi:hypothetical protein